MKGILNQLKGGLVDENPVFVQLLGMCSTLALTISISNAIGMGLAATFVLIGSNVAISLLRKFIPESVRIAAYVVVFAGFVTAVDLLIQAYFPAIAASLGIFLPLIVVNCIIIARAEAYAAHNSVFKSAIDGLAMGLGYTFALLLLTVIREPIGAGTIAGFRILPASYPQAVLVLLPPGGFLTLGFVIAAIQKIKSKKEDKAS
jgi:electron transport complex protein RnfE